MIKPRPEHRSDHKMQTWDRGRTTVPGREWKVRQRSPGDVSLPQRQAGPSQRRWQATKDVGSERELEEGKVELWFQRPLHFSHRFIGLSPSPPDVPNLWCPLLSAHHFLPRSSQQPSHWSHPCSLTTGSPNPTL